MAQAAKFHRMHQQSGSNNQQEDQAIDIPPCPQAPLAMLNLIRTYGSVLPQESPKPHHSSELMCSSPKHRSLLENTIQRHYRWAWWRTVRYANNVSGQLGWYHSLGKWVYIYICVSHHDRHCLGGQNASRLWCQFSCSSIWRRRPCVIACDKRSVWSWIN